MPLDAFWIKSENLVKGVMPGAQLDVFYPGFPTLKHIKHRVNVLLELNLIFLKRLFGECVAASSCQ